MIQKFTETTALKQLATVAAMIGALITTFGGLALWAADNKIDEKYATDADLKAVQVEVSKEIGELKTVVRENTMTVGHTVKSVDSLTLVVLNLQIEKIEDAISELEREKRTEAANWNEREEKDLRDNQRALADLEVQRRALFARLINGPPQ